MRVLGVGYKYFEFNASRQILSHPTLMCLDAISPTADVDLLNESANFPVP
jgi:hypothetical protein